jgi:hypothetical protein
MTRHRSERMPRPEVRGGRASRPHAECIERLCEDALERASSASVLARGREYAADGSVHVRRLAFEPSPSIDAVVTGSDRYAVGLRLGQASGAGSRDSGIDALGGYWGSRRDEWRLDNCRLWPPHGAPSLDALVNRSASRASGGPTRSQRRRPTAPR